MLVAGRGEVVGLFVKVNGQLLELLLQLLVLAAAAQLALGVSDELMILLLQREGQMADLGLGVGQLILQRVKPAGLLVSRLEGVSLALNF